jgi:hypothetical protein
VTRHLSDRCDFLVEQGSELLPIEVKASATPRPEMAADIEKLRSDLGARVRRGFVVHDGDMIGPLGKDAFALPFAAF